MQRFRGSVLFFGAFVAVAVGLAFLAQRLRPPDRDREIGVFFPSTSIGEWVDFVEGVRLAAGDAPVSVGGRHCAVEIAGARVVFRWYGDVGVLAMQRRVRDLCQKAKPPLALVGATNSDLTIALAEELARQQTNPAAPLLLMTTATRDDLMATYPSRSFRFGFNNSKQAAAVVDRWMDDCHKQRGIEKLDIQVSVVKAADNAFADDLALRLRAELAQRCGLSDDRFTTTELATAAGAFAEPTEAEERFARQFIDQASAAPDRQWVIVVPLEGAGYQRVCLALHRAFQEFHDPGAVAKVRANLALLAGDALDYYDFTAPGGAGFRPDRTPGTVIFFAHANPIDRAVADPPNSNTATRSLHRDLAQATLQSLAALGDAPTPAGLAQKLDEYRGSRDGPPFFDKRERRAGGGAILVEPRPAEGRFEIFLPENWRKPGSLEDSDRGAKGERAAAPSRK